MEDQEGDMTTGHDEIWRGRHDNWTALLKYGGEGQGGTSLALDFE